jgi:hypothetical protein
MWVGGVDGREEEDVRAGAEEEYHSVTDLA